MSLVQVIQNSRLVQVMSRGIAGPAGGRRYTHPQTVAASTWTVNHNLGARPIAVTVLSPGGVEVGAAVVYTSDDQLLVQFSSPQTGTVEVGA